MIPARLIPMLFGAGEGLAFVGVLVNVISGPYCIEKMDAYTAGAVIAESHSAGAVKAQSYTAGAVAGEGSC